MAGEAAPALTGKQRDVIRRIDRRMPIKLIASEMGVSETRINQHIRALKAIYGVGSLNELVESHRLAQRAALFSGADQNAGAPVTENEARDAPARRPGTPLRNGAYSKKQVGNEAPLGDLSLIHI